MMKSLRSDHHVGTVDGHDKMQARVPWCSTVHSSTRVRQDSLTSWLGL